MQAAKARTDASAWPDATTNGWRVGVAATDGRQSSNRSQPSAVRIQGAAGLVAWRTVVDAAQRHESEPIAKMRSAMVRIERMIGGRREEAARRTGGEEKEAGARSRAEDEEVVVEEKCRVSAELPGEAKGMPAKSECNWLRRERP